MTRFLPWLLATTLACDPRDDADTGDTDTAAAVVDVDGDVTLTSINITDNTADYAAAGATTFGGTLTIEYAAASCTGSKGAGNGASTATPARPRRR